MTVSTPPKQTEIGVNWRFEVRWWWLFLAVTAAATVTALTINIAAVAHDAAAEHVYRALVYSKAVDDGVLFPRWVQFLHWGLGSPIFTFQGPLPYIGLDLLHRLGIPHPIGWRILIAAGFLVAFLGAYLLVLEIGGRRWPAFLAGVAYLYAPYVLRNALERGSNEAYSMFLYPWVFWSLVWLARQPGIGRLILAAILWAACIASHVLAPLIVAPFVALAAALVSWRFRTWLPVVAVMVGILLTAGVWAPMIPEQAWVHIQKDFGTAEGNPLSGALPLDRLLALPAVFDVARDNNAMGDRTGLIQTAFLLLGIPGTVIAWRRKRRWLAVALALSTAAGLFLFWMLTGASDPVWRLAEPVLQRVQYRSRLMGAQAMFAATTAGLLLTLVPARRQPVVSFVAALALVAAAIPSLYVDLMHHFQSFGNRVSLEQVRTHEIQSGGTALTAFGEFTPLWNTRPFDQALVDELGPDFDPQEKPLANPPDGVGVRRAQVQSNAWDLEIESAAPETLTLYVQYYPRWQAFVDGEPAPIAAQPDTGLLQLDVPAGLHRVTLRYGSTFAEQAGAWISALTAVALLAAGAWSLVRRRRHSAGIAARRPGVRPAEPAPPLGVLLGLSALLVAKFAVVDPQTTWLRCVSTPQRVCGAQASVDVPFAGGPRLRGYSVSDRELAPGERLKVDLFWQGEAGSAEGPRLFSFVHIRNSQPDGPVNPQTNNEIWAQDEHYAPGGLLVTDYVPGRLYLDEYRVRLPEDMPPGEYYLEVGLFDYGTGEQLDPADEAIDPPLAELWRSVLLPSITVE